MTTVYRSPLTSWQFLIPMIAFVTLTIAQPAVADEKPEGSSEVKLRDLTLTVPAAWKKEEPKSRLRLGQFSITAAEGDKEGAELAVFNFGAGGGIEANIRRWIGQFQVKGRTVRVTRGKAAQGNYALVDLSGTYKKPIGPPVQGKTADAPGTRAVSVILAIETKGLYFLKLVGPQKTVSGQVANFRKSFGGDAEKEKEVDFDGSKPKE
jgi:gluconolactonase